MTVPLPKKKSLMASWREGKRSQTEAVIDTKFINSLEKVLTLTFDSSYVCFFFLSGHYIWEWSQAGESCRVNPVVPAGDRRAEVHTGR